MTRRTRKTGPPAAGASTTKSHLARAILSGVLALVVSAAVLPAQRVRNGDEAAALLRKLYFLHEEDDGAAIGDTLVRRFPSSTRLRAWYVANLIHAGYRTRAESLTAKIDSTSRDPWLLAAKALTLNNNSLPANRDRKSVV